MDRKPVFEIPFFNRTFLSNPDHILPTINGNPEFRRGDKGFGLAGFAANDGLSYVKTISSGVYSIVIWIRHPVSLNKFIADFRKTGGTGYVWLAGGTGLYSFSSGTVYVNNIATTTPNNGETSCVFASGITLEASHIDVNIKNSLDNAITNGNIPYFAIYSGTFTAAERDKLYQDFLSAPGPTSTPTTIHHHIPVRADESKLSDPVFDDILADPWATKINATWIGGETIFDSTGGGSVTISNTGMGLDDGKDYEFTYTVVSNAGGSIQFMISSSSFTGLTVQLSRDVGTHTYQISSNGSSDFLRLLMNSGNGTITIKDIKLKRFLSTVLVHDYQNWRGGTVPDLSPEGNDGTPVGFVDTSPDGARFDGIASYIQGASIPACVTHDGTYSIEMVVKLNSLATRQTFCQMSNSSSDRNGLSFNSATGRLTFGYYNGSWAGVGCGDIVVNEEVHLIGVNTGGSLILYVSGIGFTVAESPYFHGGAGLLIGKTSNDDNYLNGSIKLFKIYPYVLTPDGVKAKYNKIASLVGLHTMDKNLLPDERVYTAGQVITL